MADGLDSVAAIETEIQRLTVARDDRKKLLDDPNERKARRIRRQQDLGRWAEILRLSHDQMQAIRSKPDNHPAIWTDEVLEVDGWSVDDKGGWALSRAVREGGQGAP